ncbi:hypothetical protein B0H21DRAFT_841244 [Amylocystis lapponica]|nr:hypothetical protein B0H21DRAFT_841244 [Amylocystis lapponica]
MALQAAYAAVSFILPPKYFPHAILIAILLFVAHAFARGRTTNRERDLHARIVLVTGAFTPLGLSLISALAARGAHIIAVSPYPLTHAYPTVLIPLLRSTTNNPNIFADHADLSDPASIHAFCTRFLTGADQRLDAIVFGHEYRGIGSWFGSQDARTLAQTQDAASLATFLLVTLLLPALLVAPVERDIRIVTVVNPFYAAAAPEGHRARVLDSLPTRAGAAAGLERAPCASRTPRTSSPSPPARHQPQRHRRAAPQRLAARRALYTLLLPPLVLLAKSPDAALQSVLHVLFLPTPLSARSRTSMPRSTPRASRARAQTREVLKPGALYRECAVVQLRVPPLPSDAGKAAEEGKKGKGGAKGKQKSESDGADADAEDDGEFGGEAVGRAVWEWYEERLKAWEARAKAEAKEESPVASTGSGGADASSGEAGEGKPNGQ